MSPRGPTRMEALVVRAIRRLQAVQGSTAKEIGEYISQEYDVPGTGIRRQLRLALERGVAYGILRKLKGGHYGYNPDFLRAESGDCAVWEDTLIPCHGRRGRGLKRSRRRRRSRKSRRRRSRGRSGRRRRRRSRRRRTRRRRRGHQAQEASRPDPLVPPPDSPRNAQTDESESSDEPTTEDRTQDEDVV